MVKEEMKANGLPLGSDKKDVPVFIELGVVIDKAGKSGFIGSNALQDWRRRGTRKRSRKRQCENRKRE
jgi:hypothetical protein